MGQCHNFFSIGSQLLKSTDAGNFQSAQALPEDWAGSKESLPSPH